MRDTVNQSPYKISLDFENSKMERVSLGKRKSLEISCLADVNTSQATKSRKLSEDVHIDPSVAKYFNEKL